MIFSVLSVAFFLYNTNQGFAVLEELNTVALSKSPDAYCPVFKTKSLWVLAETRNSWFFRVHQLTYLQTPKYSNLASLLSVQV